MERLRLQHHGKPCNSCANVQSARDKETKNFKHRLQTAGPLVDADLPWPLAHKAPPCEDVKKRELRLEAEYQRDAVRAGLDASGMFSPG